MLQDQPGSPYILHRCQIPVPDPRTHSQYLVSVRPKEEEKFIKSSENSEFAPSLLCEGLGTALFYCVTQVNSGLLMAQSPRASLSTQIGPLRK